MGKATVVPAQVPIAKVYNAKGEGLVDVSVNNCAALENSMLIQTFGEIDARVRPLGRFIKYWAKQRNINNRSIELCKATSGGISSTPNQFSPASLPAPSSSSSPPSSISEGQALSLQTEERCRNSSSSSYEKRSSETVMDDKIEKERERGRGHERREAGEKREDKGVIIPAEGLRPLPFSMDSQRIRRELIEKYGENKESLGQLIRDFFLFYGDRKKSSILGSRDGALVVIEVYDASVSIHDAEYTDLLPPDNAAIRSILSSHSMTPSSFSSSPSFSSPSDTSASLSPSSSPSSGNLSPPSEGLVSATSSAPVRDEMGDTFRCLSGHPDRTCVDEGKTLFSVDMCSDSEESGREKKEEIKSHGELRRGRRYEDDYMEEEEEKRKKDAGTEEEEESEAYDDEHDERREEEFFSFFHKKNRRLVMKCPLTRQIVNRFSSSAWEIICSEFQRAEHLLRHQQGSLEDICLPASLSHRQTKKLSRLQRRNMIRSLALSRGLLVSTGFVDSATEGQLKEDLKKTSGGERRRHDTPISSPGFSCDSYSRSEHRYEIDSHVSLSMKIENRTAVCATPTTSDVSPSLTPPRVSSRRLAVSSNEIFHPVPSPSHTDTACHNSDGNLSARVSTYSHDKRDWEEEKGTNEVRKFSTGSLFISSLSPSSSPFSSSTSPRSFVRHDKTDHTLHYRKTPASCISVQTQQLSLHLPHGGPRASHQTTALRVGSINGKAAVDGDEKKRNRSLALLSVNRRDQTRRTSLKNSSSVISSSSSSSTLSYVSGRGVGFSDLSQSCRNSDDGGFTCNQPGGGCYYRERSPCIPSSEEKQKHAVPRNIGDGHKVGGDTGSLSHSRLTMSMGPEKLNRDESLALRHSNGTAYMKEKDGGDKEDVDVLLHELQIAQWKLRTQLEEHLRSLRYQFYRVLQNSAVTTSNDNNSATIAPLQ
ncbi:polynucleotide [Cystoisospora suis]|uniref:Polynucleotide n=1 Tax=Cystoisospora suis TaxID=483139 RepID=A0A2C6L5Y4_9APIC|nr:polynucleotide [Cystoisospora suis]